MLAAFKELSWKQWLGGCIAAVIVAVIGLLVIGITNGPQTPIVQHDDPYDTDPQTRLEAEADVASHPAVQKLPLISPTIYADLYDRADDGKLIIVAEHTGTRQQAEREWKSFLEANGDSGSDYRVHFTRRRAAP